MKINNTDISVYNAKQLNFTYNHNAISNGSAWAAGAAVPYFAPNKYGFASYTLALAVHGNGREEIRRNCSDIIAQLQKPADLTLDGFSTRLRVILRSHNEIERSLQRYHRLELTFDGYEYGETVTASGITLLTIKNPGNMPSPGIITLTPSANVSHAFLTGICFDAAKGGDLPVTVEDMTNGIPVILDGLTGLITEAGAPREVEMWTLPMFLPGVTTITCTSEDVAVTAQCIPIYA